MMLPFHPNGMHAASQHACGFYFYSFWGLIWGAGDVTTSTYRGLGLSRGGLHGIRGALPAAACQHSSELHRI